MNKFKKFDLLVIVLVLVSVSVLALKFLHVDTVSPGAEGVEYQKATLQYAVEDVRVMSAEAFNVGDILLSDETNHKIGTITDVQVMPYVKALEKADGSIVYAEVPEKYRVLVTVDTELSQRETGYFAYGITEVKNNSTTVVYTKYIKSVSKVEAIEIEN